MADETPRWPKDMNLLQLLALGERSANGCLIWTRDRNRYGYGQFKQLGKRIGLTRRIWSLANGPILAGEIIRHTCDTPPCYEPAHLIPGTHAQNYADMLERGRHPCGATTTHCSKGHERTEENTYWRPDRPGQRLCRPCKNGRR